MTAAVLNTYELLCYSCRTKDFNFLYLRANLIDKNWKTTNLLFLKQIFNNLLISKKMELEQQNLHKN